MTLTDFRVLLEGLPATMIRDEWQSVSRVTTEWNGVTVSGAIPDRAVAKAISEADIAALLLGCLKPVPQPPDTPNASDTGMTMFTPASERRSGRIRIASWSFPSSDGSRVYETIRWSLADSEGGYFSCNCRGWTVKKEGKPRVCKHVAACGIAWMRGTPPAGAIPTSVPKIGPIPPRRLPIVTRFPPIPPHLRDAFGPGAYASHQEWCRQVHSECGHDPGNAAPRQMAASEACFDGRNLAGAWLVRAMAPNASFRDANLVDAVFRGASLQSAVFTGAGLNGADFSGAKLAGAFFTDADLTGAKFDGADVSGATFLRAKLGGASWNRAKGAGVLNRTPWSPPPDVPLSTSWERPLSPRKVAAPAAAPTIRRRILILPKLP